jgi:signal transduction histidine kinase
VPDEPRVLLVQFVVLTAELRLNGSLLNPGVRFYERGGLYGTVMHKCPHWIVLPSGLFKPGRNELMIRLKGDPVTPAWISGISIGPPDELRGEFLLREIPQRLVPQVLFVLLLAAMVFCLRVWWRERLPLQGLVLTTTVLWLGTLGIYLAPDLPVPWRLMVALVAALWIAYQWALMKLLWRLSDGGWPWFPRLLAIGSVLPLLGTALVLATEPAQQVLGLLMLPTALLRCLTTVMLLSWVWRVRTWSAALLTACELLWFAGPVQLMLVALDVLPPEPFMLDPGAALPLFLVLLWLAAQQLATQRERAAAERVAAVQAERQRMMLDMHDGVGGQLATAVRLAQRDDVPRVQEALHDLRLVIDSLDPGADGLPPLLGLLRDRVEPRLRALDQRLEIHLDDVPGPRRLSPAAALDVLRIVQEALNNALRHGRGTSLVIRLQAAPGGCELSVSDDGRGIEPTVAASADAAPGGRGIASMQRRAARLGGRLHVGRGHERGTVVRLWLPRTLEETR